MLEAAGCGKVITRSKDEPHGLLKELQDGDVLVITKLSYLAHSMEELHGVVKELHVNGIAFRTVGQAVIDGKQFIGCMQTLMEFEQDIVQVRIREGQEAARLRGVKFGRKAVLTDEQITELKQDVAERSMPMVQIGKKYGISRDSVYRLARQ